MIAAPTARSVRAGTGPEGQDAVIAFLSQPGAYGAGAPPVERIDTHISVIFLVGERAYKLKRAVKFGYLDYSTRELRRRFCEAEVAINRRTAGDMYVGVVAVRRTADGGLTIDGAGDPVDWLVEMTRFDQETLFDRLAQRGALTPALVVGLADTVSAFHLAAERRAGGGADGMRWVVESNDREIAQRVPDIFDARAATRFTAACEKALQGTAGLLDLRAREGLVRRCHGDLHLRNVCLVAGRPTPFDAIEFNDALTDIDVLYDLAFLVMDLEHRGLREAANALLNRYMAATGDVDGLAAMPLFLACRAGIRAHTAAAAADAQTDPAEAKARRAEARQYLALGRGFLKPAPARLVAVGGLSGSGKSALARALAPAIGRAPGAMHVQSDVIRKRLFGRPPEARLDPGAYTPDVTREVYARLFDQAARALSAGHAVVADATFMDAAQRAAIEAVADSAGVPFAGLWLDASPAVLESRIAARSGGASDATVAVLRAQLRHPLGAMSWTAVDAGGAADRTLRRARRRLEEWPSRPDA